MKYIDKRLTRYFVGGKMFDGVCKGTFSREFRSRETAGPGYFNGIIFEYIYRKEKKNGKRKERKSCSHAKQD